MAVVRARRLRVVVAMVWVLFATSATSLTWSAADATASAPLAWHVAPADPPKGYPEAIDCPTSTFCAALDEYGNAVLERSGVWSHPVPLLPDETNDFVAIDCTSATFCLALISNGFGHTYLFDGSSWQPASFATPQDLQSVSCVSPTLCRAITYGQYVWTFNGTGWTDSTHVPAWGYGGSNVISCVSTTFCAAITPAGYDDFFDGTTWTLGPVTAVETKSLTCVTSTFCLALAQGDQIVRWNGAAWTVAATAPGRNFTSVSCATVSFCAAVDEAGNAIVFKDGTWTPSTKIDGQADIDAVSCTAAETCVAVDRVGFAVEYTGGTWHPRVEIDRLRGLADAVSCVSPDFCAAADLRGDIAVYRSRAWSYPRALTTDLLRGVSCATSTFCVAVGGSDSEAFVDSFNAETTAAPHRYPGLIQLRAVSCPSPTFCVAVGGYEVLTYNGRTWHVAYWTAPANELGGLIGVSCPVVGSCTAIGNYGALTLQSGRWTYLSMAQVLADNGSDILTGLSCPAPQQCALGTFRGKVYVLAGSTLSSPTNVVTNSIDAISCPTTTFCAAADSYYGNIAIVSGGAWSTQAADPGYAMGIEGMSCVSVGFCMAMDRLGHTVTGTGSTPAPPTVSLTRPANRFARAPTVDIAWTLHGGGAHVQVRYRVAAWNSAFSDYRYPATWQYRTGTGFTHGSLRFGDTYCYSARTFGSDGGRSAWSAERCATVPLDDRGVSADRDWTRIRGASYLNGTATSTHTPGATLTLPAAHLRYVALVATTCSTCGRVALHVAGRLLARVNLYSTITRNRVLITLPSVSLRSATIIIKTLDPKLVRIDGLGVSQR